MKIIIIKKIDDEDHLLIYPESFSEKIRMFIMWILTPFEWHIDKFDRWCLKFIEKMDEKS